MLNCRSDLEVNNGQSNCRQHLIKRKRTEEERERMAVSQKKYYAKKNETDPE